MKIPPSGVRDDAQAPQRLCGAKNCSSKSKKWSQIAEQAPCITGVVYAAHHHAWKHSVSETAAAYCARR